jgi:hypothetical protein
MCQFLRDMYSMIRIGCRQPLEDLIAGRCFMTISIFTSQGLVIQYLARTLDIYRHSIKKKNISITFIFDLVKKSVDNLKTGTNE